MFNPADLTETLGKWALYALGLIAAFFAGLKKISGDRLQVKQDSAAAIYIERMRADSDEALARERADHAESRARERETWALHIEDAKAITRLEVKSALQAERIERQKKEIALLKRMMAERNPRAAAYLDTGFGELFCNDPPAP